MTELPIKLSSIGTTQKPRSVVAFCPVVDAAECGWRIIQRTGAVR